MKKIILAIVVFLFMAGVLNHSYSQSYYNSNINKNNVNNNNDIIKSSGSALYTDPPKTAATEKLDDSHSGGALFRADPSTGDPGGRPSDGQGVGQETPLRGGFHFLLICGLIYGAVNVFARRRRQQN